MEQFVRRMFARDISVVVGFMVFLWVTMGYLVYSILTTVSDPQTRAVITAIGIVTLLFATLCLLALMAHLRRHRDAMYAEELRHSGHEEPELEAEQLADVNPVAADVPPGAPAGLLVKIFDISFVIILCFVTLLATMLLRGKTANGAGIYTVGVVSGLITVVGFSLYFIYTLVYSQKELKLMVNEMYPDDKAAGIARTKEGARQ